MALTMLFAHQHAFEYSLHVGSKSCLYELAELNFLSVGFQLPPRTLNTFIDSLIYLFVD